MSARIQSWAALQCQWCGLKSPIPPYCGQVGVVSNIDRGAYPVTFNGGRGYGYKLYRLLATCPPVRRKAYDSQDVCRVHVTLEIL